MADQPATPAHYCPACRTTTPAPQATAEQLVQAGVDHRAECTGAADLRQRIADTIRTAAYDCDGNCGLTETECDAQHPIQVAAQHWGVTSSVYADIDPLADVAAAAVQPELDQLRAEASDAISLREARMTLQAFRHAMGSTATQITDLIHAIGRANGPAARAQREAAHYRRRWESTVVEARRQAARADAAEAARAKARASTGRRRAVLRSTVNENDRLRAELDRTRAELAKADSQLRAIALIRVWRNEDGREFMFADDIRPALDLPPSTVSTPTD